MSRAVSQNLRPYKLINFFQGRNQDGDRRPGGGLLRRRRRGRHLRDQRGLRPQFGQKQFGLFLQQPTRSKAQRQRGHGRRFRNSNDRSSRSEGHQISPKITSKK